MEYSCEEKRGVVWKVTLMNCGGPGGSEVGVTNYCPGALYKREETIAAKTITYLISGITLQHRKLE